VKKIRRLPEMESVVMAFENKGSSLIIQEKYRETDAL
jgi:hypothetical protein